MKQYIKQHWFEYIYAAILTIVTAIVISLMFGYGFSTNDDAMLRNIVNGNYTGTPDAHLIYIMYPLGFILKCLYELTAEVFWYDLFMTGMHYVCWFMIMVRLGNLFQKKVDKIISVTLGLLGLIVIDLSYLVMHQYTILAALLVSVAIFWLITSNHTKGSVYWFEMAIVLVFLILSLWVRKQVFYLAMPPVCLAFALKAYLAHKDNGEKKVMMNKLVFIVILSVLVLGSLGVEKVAYSSEEWKDFLAYNDARTTIYDYYGIPAYSLHEGTYTDLGLDAGDWLAIDAYNSELVYDLNLDKMQVLAEKSEQIWMEGFQYTSISRMMIYAVVNVFYHNPVQPIGIILTCLYIITLLHCYKKDKKPEFVATIVLLLFQFAVVGYFSWQGRFLERVSYGFYFIQMMYLLGMILSYAKETEHAKKKSLHWCIIWGLVLVFLFGTTGLYQVLTTLDAKERLNVKCEKWEAINDYFEQDKEKFYCIDTKSFVFSSELMFVSDDIESSNMIRLGSWVQYSPLDEQHNNGVDNWLDKLVAGEGYYVQDAIKGMDWINYYLSQKGYTAEAKVIDTIVTADGTVYEVISLEQ